MKQDSHSKENNQTQGPGILSVVQSVLAAMVGIQSDEKRQQDFEQGHPGTYIFIGIVFVIIFILVLVNIVNSILNEAGMA